MKKLFLALPIFFAIACGDAGTKDPASKDAAHDDHAGHNHAPGEGHGAAPAKAVSYKTHDPICGMERTAEWTEYSVYNGDTVKFCAPVCKETFDKNPAEHTKG